jgi:hypothetical protein
MNKNYISLNQLVIKLQTEEKIPVKSFPTIRSHVIYDITHENNLRAKAINSRTGRGKRGLRYYIPVENIQKFIDNFLKTE